MLSSKKKQPNKREVKIIDEKAEQSEKEEIDKKKEDNNNDSNNRSSEMSKLKIKRQVTQSNSSNSLSEEASNQLLSVFNGNSNDGEENVKKEEKNETDVKGPISLTEKLKLRANKFKKK